MDFSLVLQVNVYKLAKKFHKLCQDIPIDMQSNTDVTTYIPRFVNMMEFGDKTELITNTACKLAHQMKNDWITTGRRPSGVCGASIFMAAKIHGFQRTPEQIISYVNLSKATLKKRVSEFLSTKAAKMSINQFKQLNNIQSLPSNEKPPIIKQQELKEFKMKQKQQFIKKTKEKIAKYDKEFDEKNNINRDENRYSFKKDENDNDNDSDNEDDDIASLMKCEKVQFVPATDTDDALINNNKESNDESSSLSSINNNETMNSNINDGYFSHVSVQRIDGTNSNFTNNQNDNDYDDIDNNSIKDDKNEICKYFEENDLSIYDDDPAVKSMILSTEEIAAKNKLFEVLNPDWKKVKKDMDRRAMKKEEQDKKSNKRKLCEIQQDKMRDVKNRVNKRFKVCSDRINPEAFERLTGIIANPSSLSPPSTVIKTNDPLSI